MFKFLQRENLLRQQKHKRLKPSPPHNFLMSLRPKDRRQAVKLVAKLKVNNRVSNQVPDLNKSKYNRKRLLSKIQQVTKM